MAILQIAGDMDTLDVRFDLTINEGLRFECMALLDSNKVINVEFLADKNRTRIGWEKRRSFAADHKEFAKK